VPEELLFPTKEIADTIPLTWLGQPRPPTYRLEPGDVLGVYVEGFLGDRDTPATPPIHIGPLYQMRDQRRLPPAAGFPIPVEDDGSVYLPSAGALLVRGMSIPEAREAMRKLYVSKKLLKEDNERIVVTLLHSRQYQVVVLRQEASSFLSPLEGTAVSSKRGTGVVIDLPAYENDVLHALAQSGGLPGLDAFNAVLIERNAFHAGADPAAILHDLENRPPTGSAGPAVCVAPVVRIPLRQPPDAPSHFRPEDVLLQSGDVVFLEARDNDVFYTAGLLPPGVWVIPRDHDLDVVEAIARVRGPLFNGAFGGSNLAGNLIAPGIGSPSPSLLVVLRRLPSGGQVPIVVDLGSALRHHEERILVRAGDVLLLQEQPGEALARYVTQTFFNFEVLWEAFHSKFVTGVVDVAAPDRLPQRFGTVNVVPR
jgi:protein involved in polysaccharide export with SLBB domain